MGVANGLTIPLGSVIVPCSEFIKATVALRMDPGTRRSSTGRPAWARLLLETWRRLVDAGAGVRQPTPSVCDCDLRRGQTVPRCIRTGYHRTEGDGAPTVLRGNWSRANG